MPAVTRGDPTRLLQVVTNFGSNAIKFTSAGAIEIRATQVGSDEEPARLRVEVKDTGIGISKERLAVVFRAFSQADVSTTRRFGGTGLGLAISREIVEAKGGDIGCVSELGEGSTFWLEIPLVASESGQAQLSIARMREQLSGLRVLAVDDVDTNRQILCEQLAWWHVECDAVESARAAIERLESHRYDAIILDMAMPEIDGLTLATMLRRREDTREIPMVLLTSQLPPDEATLASHGIDQCLVKPVSSAVIRDCLLRLTPGPVEEPSAQPRPLERRSDRRILVVEDNQVNRIVASGFLEALGYDHDLAVDGVEALEMLERRSYDLVLMDLQMPRLDGLSATEALREREGDGRRTPVVAMTAAAVESERDRAFAAGMDDFVTKPVNRARLGEVLSQWLSTGSTPPIEGTGQVVLTGALNVARLEELRELTPDGSYVRRAGTNFNLRVPALVDAVIGAEDGQALEAAAHTLSGSASNLGLDRVAAIAQALESAGRANELADPLLITELERSVAEATVALDDYLSELAAG